MSRPFRSYFPTVYKYASNLSNLLKVPLVSSGCFLTLQNKEICLTLSVSYGKPVLSVYVLGSSKLQARTFQSTGNSEVVCHLQHLILEYSK